MAGKKAAPGENWANSQIGQDSGLPSNSGAPNGRVSGGIYDLYRNKSETKGTLPFVTEDCENKGSGPHP